MGYLVCLPEQVCMHHSLDTLELRPETFSEYLTSQLGMEIFHLLNVGDSMQGFDRPMYVFRKQM